MTRTVIDRPGSGLGLRFAEAVCAGHPDRLCDSIADGVVELATGRDPEALVGVEVTVHRSVVFVDGRIAAGDGPDCAVTEAEVAEVVREAYRRAGYRDTPGGPSSPAGCVFGPAPEEVETRFDLCLGPLGDNGLSGKKLVAEAYGTAVPVGGGTGRRRRRRGSSSAPETRSRAGWRRGSWGGGCLRPAGPKGCRPAPRGRRSPA